LDSHVFFHEKCHQHLFQNYEKVFGAYMDKFLKVFVDDLNVHSLIWEEHIDHLRYMFMRLKEVNLKLNPCKCECAKSKLIFLGQEVTRKGTQPDPKKIKVAINFPIPTSATNVWVFLGLIRYYKNYVKGYSRIAIPLFDLTEKDTMFNCQETFDILKITLISTPILVKLDFTKPFILDVN
jgi:hypothetical protein